MRPTAWLVLAACYRPTITTGNPCTGSGPCPLGQVCSALTHTCELTQGSPDGGEPDSVLVDASPPQPCANGIVFMHLPAIALGSGMGPRAVAIADVDGDHHADAIVTDGDANLISIARGNGDGTFQTPTTLATGTHPWSIAVGDLDGDGDVDLVVGNYDDGTITRYLDNGAGAFAAATFPAGASPQSVAIVDVTGDGLPDVVAASHTINEATVLVGDGHGGFATLTTIATGTGPYQVASADFNHDGVADLASANTTAASVSVLLGRGAGQFQAKVDYSTGTSTQPWSIAVGDLDRDGHPDVVVANNYGNTSGEQTVAVFPGTGDGTLGARIDLTSRPYAWWVALADFDGDGVLDLAVADGDDGAVSIWLGNGDLTFQPRADVTVGLGTLELAVGDLDGDGRPDIVTADATDDTASVLLTRCK
ncbi:MAG TPA: VCBS repeat-containing protein [Kofleriaceae bacterium]|nr:VCBS repeat-containing protein [Kofleriaceae bacterium]